MDYIMKGDPKAIGKILQENSIRVRRGEVKFIPVTEANYNVLVADDKYVSDPDGCGCSDSKEPTIPVDQKKPRKTKKSE